MQFNDLATQQQRIAPLIEKNIRNILEHGKYIIGPDVQELEEKLGAYVGVKHAIGCSSGTDALLLALMAYGIGPGDAILATPFTFIATAEAISLLGATPVFVDIDQKTFNIDPEKLRQTITTLKNGDPARHPLPVNHGSGSLTLKGIIAVDLYGLPTDYGQINKVAREHGLVVIEYGAQSFGGGFQNNQACSMGDIACTSFFPAKPLACYGDGGMCFTNDDDLAEAIRSLCVYGKGQHYYDNVRIWYERSP